MTAMPSMKLPAAVVLCFVSAIRLATGQQLVDPSLFVANGTRQFVSVSCSATQPATIPANTRLIYSTAARSFLFTGQFPWTRLNLDGSVGALTQWQGGFGSPCTVGMQVCEESALSARNVVVSPYLGAVSAFAPAGGLLAVVIDIEFQMTCSVLPPCTYNTVKVLAWPVQAQRQTIDSADVASFTSIGLLDGVGRAALNLGDLPRLTERLYYRVPARTGGLYIAFEAAGACVGIVPVSVSYCICLAATVGEIVLPQSTSLDVSRRVLGRCAAQRNLVPDVTSHEGNVSVECSRDGVWITASVLGQCICDRGYDRPTRSVPCSACRSGTYKPNVGDAVCLMCPANSDSSTAALRCGCKVGFYRDTSSSLPDIDTMACLGPPRQLVASQFTLDNITASSIELSWSATQSDGGRADITYEVSYRQSNESSWIPVTGRTGSSLTATLLGLLPFTNYSIRVFTRSGISDEAGLSASDGTELNLIQTGESTPSLPRSVRLSPLANGVRVHFSEPEQPNGVILGYRVVLMHIGGTARFTRNVTGGALSVDFFNLTDTQRTYQAEVGAYTSAGFGRFRTSVNRISPGPSDFTPPPPTTTPATTSTAAAETDIPSSSIDLSVVVGAVCGGVIFVVVCLIIVIVIVYHRRSRASPKYNVRVSRSASSSTEMSSPSSASIFRRRSLSARSATQENTNYSPPVLGQLSGTENRQFVDPTIYHDVSQALHDFTQEINPAFVVLKKQIGEGEFAYVHRGEVKISNKSSQIVAVKVLKEGADHVIKKDFLMEACILGQFQCPNIVALIGICSKDRNRPAMIMTEYMENGSLDHYLQTHDQQFKPNELVAMSLDAARGMEYLSGMNFIHRDLAARNILVSITKSCKVSDFGLSREADDENAYEVKHGGKLPIRWTAPEAIQFRKFTTSSDVWSFGILLWEVMSYAERPYWDWGNSEVMDAITQRKYRLPPPAGCPNVVHNLMLECWNKERTQRPTFPQLREKIEHMLQSTLPMENIADVQVPDHNAPISPYSSIEDWLKNLQLSQYTENFTACGYAQVSQCLEISIDDLAMIGIVLPAPQRKILNNLAAMRVYSKS